MTSHDFRKVGRFVIVVCLPEKQNRYVPPATAVARAVPVASLEPAATDGRGLVGLDGCEVCLCDPCARVRPCVPCVSRLPPVSFYRYVPVP